MWYHRSSCLRKNGPSYLSHYPFCFAKIGHLVVDVLEPLFYAMLEMVGGDLSLWDTDIILGELFGCPYSVPLSPLTTQTICAFRVWHVGSFLF